MVNLIGKLDERRLVEQVIDYVNENDLTDDQQDLLTHMVSQTAMDAGLRQPEPPDPDAKRYREHSRMLGQIASVTADWCLTPECTTEDAARLAVADARYYRGLAERLQIERHYEA